MNEIELAELVHKVQTMWEPNDIDVWRTVLAGVDYHDAKEALNVIARTSSYPSVDALVAELAKDELPAQFRMTEAEREAGLAQLEILRAKHAAARKDVH